MPLTAGGCVMKGLEIVMRGPCQAHGSRPDGRARTTSRRTDLTRIRTSWFDRAESGTVRIPSPQWLLLADVLPVS